VNNGPTEACFDLSFGSLEDLKALLAAGPDEEAGSGDDRLAAFLQVARIRVRGGTQGQGQGVCGGERSVASTCVGVTLAARLKVKQIHGPCMPSSWMSMSVQEPYWP
jgi:hypothetical protein